MASSQFTERGGDACLAQSRPPPGRRVRPARALQQPRPIRALDEASARRFSATPAVKGIAAGRQRAAPASAARPSRPFVFETFDRFEAGRDLARAYARQTQDYGLQKRHVVHHFLHCCKHLFEEEAGRNRRLRPYPTWCPFNAGSRCTRTDYTS